MLVTGFRVLSLNSHASSGEKCVEIVKTLHVKFFPFGSAEPVWSVTVKINFSWTFWYVDIHGQKFANYFGILRILVPNCVVYLNHRLLYLRIDPASANLSRHRPFLSFTRHFRIFDLIHILSSQTMDRNLTVILSINSIYVTRTHLWYLLWWWIQND